MSGETGRFSSSAKTVLVEGETGLEGDVGLGGERSLTFCSVMLIGFVICLGAVVEFLVFCGEKNDEMFLWLAPPAPAEPFLSLVWYMVYKKTP